MLRVIGRAPFVGRQPELAALLARLEAAGRKAGGVELVSGEPGVGKTRLLAELALQAAATGWRVFNGRAYDAEGMPPYLPFSEALHDYVRTCPTETLLAQLADGAPQMALLTPDLARRLPDLSESPALSSEHERYRLFEIATDFLLAIASGIGEVHEVRGGLPRSCGLLLVLDDLHWADGPTLALLLHLARRLPDQPLLVACAYRPVDLDRKHPLAGVLAELNRERLAEPSLLTPLSPAGTAALIAGINESPAAPPIVAAIHRETDGNPFFVEEVVRHLQMDGRDLADARAVVADWGIPDGVRQAIGMRLSHLSPEANRALQVGTVLGEDFRLEVLTAMWDLDAGLLADALDEALAAGLLRETGDGHRFTHALIRQTLYDELRLPRRQFLHLRAAEAIERVHARNLGPFLAALAGHYRLAGAAAEQEKTVEFSRRAAEASMAVFAWETAAAHWQAALHVLEEQGTAPADEARCFELLVALGGAQLRAGDRPAARGVFEQAAAVARHQENADWLARAALGLGVTVVAGEVDEVLVALLEEALRWLGEEDSVLRARVLACRARHLRLVEAAAASTILSQQAIDMARRVGDREALIWALDAKALALGNQQFANRPDDVERLEIAAAVVGFGEETGDRMLVLRGQLDRIWYALEQGDLAQVDATFEGFQRNAAATRQPAYQWHVALLLALRALLAGRLSACEEHVHGALSVGGRINRRTADECFWWQLFALRREQGRLTEIDAQLRKVVGERLPERWALPCVAALLAGELGREREAREAFELLAAQEFDDLPRNGSWLFVCTLLAEICAQLGDGRRAAMLYRRLAPFADRAAGVTPFTSTWQGSVSRYLGMLATTTKQWDEAARYFINAVAMNARMGALPLVAHTRREHAAMLLAQTMEERGPRATEPDLAGIEQVRRLLGDAQATYGELGMTYFAEKTRELLRVVETLSGAPRRPPYPNRLSDREVEVLRLVAVGKSNREIAERLVISVNTVFQHMRSIFNKTGMSNRTEAAAYALRHGLVE